ncbi:MAG: imidazole glycerol phosphate synthase subunit HisH [Planctomycetota bacterium]
MITIVDYKAGNLTSVKLAFEHIGIDVRITDRTQDILAAKRIVFPGVGAAGSAMDNLRRLKILEPIRQIINSGIPFLGICIGMQLLFDYSEENNGTDCIRILPGCIKRFRSDDPICKIPQMGWNSVKIKRAHPLFAGIEDKSEFYFVHSYYPSPDQQDIITGQTEYARIVFASAAGRANVFATQFHPERSGRIGLKLLENFSKWDGQC